MWSWQLKLELEPLTLTKNRGIAIATSLSLGIEDFWSKLLSWSCRDHRYIFQNNIGARGCRTTFHLHSLLHSWSPTNSVELHAGHFNLGLAHHNQVKNTTHQHEQIQMNMIIALSTKHGILASINWDREWAILLNLRWGWVWGWGCRSDQW